MFVFRMLMFTLMRLCLCLCASENSIRQISGFVLLMFLLMLTLMSRVFSLVMLMLCLCASENQPLKFTKFHIFLRIGSRKKGLRSTLVHVRKFTKVKKYVISEKEESHLDYCFVKKLLTCWWIYFLS